jgi:hypothetical protein
VARMGRLSVVDLIPALEIERTAGVVAEKNLVKKTTVVVAA